MAEGLARLLSKQDFNPDAFVSKQAHGALDGLEELHQQVSQLQEDTAVALKKNVYKNYYQFIETAKEISILEGEMYQLSHLLTDQKSIMTSMMELSVTGHKVDSPDEMDSAVGSADDDVDSQKNLAFLLEKVEGCVGITDVPGRYLVHSGDLVELDAESCGHIQRVHLFLLNDNLLIASLLPYRKGPVKYKFQKLYELDSLAVVNVRDNVNIKNAFKILMFPDTRMFAAESPKAKRQWLDILEETKRKKSAMESQRKEAAHHVPNQDQKLPSKSSKAAASSAAAVDVNPSVNLVTESELIHIEWVQELPEDLDVCIAQRDFEGAVDLIQKITDYLDNCPKHSSVREYRSRIELRVKQLTEVLMHELQVSPERSIRGGPRSARRAVAQLIRLGKSVQACELFLKNRSAICRYSLRQLKTESNTVLYIHSMCQMFFSSLSDTGREFMKAFPQHYGCFSAFILWAKQEVQHFVSVFASQVFVSKANVSTVAECVAKARSCCGQLSEIGLEMNFILDRLFANDLEKLIQQTGDNQMDAIRHRAAEDHWRPVNYQNEDSIRKFEADMKALGIDNIKDFTYDECFTYLTANTIQFTRSYVSFCDDLLKLYIPDFQPLVASAFSDIFTAQIQNLKKSAESEQFRNELNVIGQNARFLRMSLLPLVRKKYDKVTIVALAKLDVLERTLKQVEDKVSAPR